MFPNLSQPFSHRLAQTPELVPDQLAAELHVPSDRTQLVYRQLRQRAIDLGWQLSTPGMQKVLPQATVIGSPQRREPDSERTFVFPETPTSVPPPMHVVAAE